MEYKEVNLRDFRHNLTELRDSGKAYAILKKGKLYGFFVPSDSEYEIKIVKKHKSDKQKRFVELLEHFKEHPAEFKDEVKDAKSAKEAYHRLLDIEYSYLREDNDE